MQSFARALRLTPNSPELSYSQGEGAKSQKITTQNGHVMIDVQVLYFAVVREKLSRHQEAFSLT